MVEHAFDNIENYLEFFKEIDEIHKIKENTLKGIISEIKSKFADILEDKPKKQDEFLIPDIPKLRNKEPKEERPSTRASKRNPSVANTTSSQNDLSAIQNDSESFRRSSRLASKVKVKPNDAEIIRKSSRVASKSKLQTSHVAPHNTDKSENIVQNSTYIVSPSHPPTKIRRTNEHEVEPKKSNERRSPLEESVCAVDMKKPLGASTPTSPISVPVEIKAKKTPEKPKTPKENKTPTNSDIGPAKGESVKKRIEEFEKRAKGNLLPSKLPVKTPEKSKVTIPLKKNTKTSSTKRDVFTEDECSVTETRTLRTNSKILQEKNTNVKPSKEKASDAQKKKTTLMKTSMEENKRKREERERKVAAQREAAEKEKLLAAMKLEKEKEMKMKLHQKMKEEKLREETLRKKQIAAFKAAEMEERRKQEAIKLAKIKKAQNITQDQPKEEVPQYSIGTLLENDSSEDEENPKKQVPSWATKKMREHPLIVQAWLKKKHTVYAWFYNKHLKYPKLEELFSTEVKTRPRTSSAFWNSRICFNESFPIL